jgi:hypothetical protein
MTRVSNPYLKAFTKETEMAEIRIVEVYGLKIDSRCADLLRIVMKYAKSGDCDARETRRAALKKLGDYGCVSALTYIIDQLATSGDCDARETRRTAMELL